MPRVSPPFEEEETMQPPLINSPIEMVAGDVLVNESHAHLLLLTLLRQFTREKEPCKRPF